MDKLNEKQKEVVLNKTGPVLVIAGAGAGKTKTITERILGLIKNGVEPRSILAITFTNKAANELKERVEKVIQGESYGLGSEERPFIGTFHSLGVKIIRENSKLLNLPKHFNIFDKEDSKKAVKEAIKEIGEGEDLDPSSMLQAISRKKGELKTPDDLEIDLEEGRGSGFINKSLSRVWEKYENILFREKALDFDDLLLKTTTCPHRNYSNTANRSCLWNHRAGSIWPHSGVSKECAGN